MLDRARARQPARTLPNGAVFSASQRRSEIDVAMDDLRNSKGALRNEKACLKSIQMFNLAYPVDEKGESQVSERDLGLLLEAISMTGSTQLQRVLVERGGTACVTNVYQSIRWCVVFFAKSSFVEKSIESFRKLVDRV